MARKPVENPHNLFLRGKIYYVHHMQKGKRLIQSTGTSILDDAVAFRDRVLNPFNLKDQREQAEAVLARVAGLDMQIAKSEESKPATAIEHGWQAYLDQSNRPDSGESTLRQYEFQYEAFAKWFIGNHPREDKDKKPIRWELRQVTQEDVDTYAAQLIKKVSPTTFNRHIVLLALMWRVLEKTARLHGNPWKSIERKRFAVHSRRELTVDELGKVFNAANGEMRLLLGLGTFCGLRLGDAAGLQWSNVDLVKGIITLIPHKTARRSQKRITLPIHAALRVMLEDIPKGNRHGLLLPEMSARYELYDGALAKDVARLFLSVNIKTGANALTKAEKDALKEAKAAPKKAQKALKEGKDVGIEPPPVKPKGKGNKGKEARASADCGFHSLRHTFVSLCAAGGVPQSIVQSLVGHGSPAMTAHYTHIDMKTAQDAVALLPDVTGSHATEAVSSAAGAKLEAALAGLEGLSKEELKKVGKRVKELVGK